LQFNHKVIPRASPMPQRKTATFNLRMDPALKARAEKAAAEDRRSLASLTAVLLAKHCKEREQLTQDSPKRGRK
jgi:hypothetical protein